jgi:pimeloyl-ACP methyl ester carboxylesterase
MQSIKNDGVILAYEGRGSGSPPILFVHGWSCDHAAFAQQAEFFHNPHRVVLVDPSLLQIARHNELDRDFR